jgi:hypothetical protein
MNILLDPTVPDADKKYLVQFDDSTVLSVPLTDMPDLVPSRPSPIIDDDVQDTLLPKFLQLRSKITFEKDGEYHKGYLGKKNGIYRFVFKRHFNSKQEEWGVPLPDLSTTWTQLCVEGILQPGHQASSFLRSAVAKTFDPVANIVSAVNLHRDCPSSLMQALADSNPDREVWLQSYYEEKDSIESLGTYQKLSLGEYRALREKGAPRAIPTMCVLTIKKDENLLPVRAKSRIVVLGNHEDRVWSKSDRYAPVL